MSYFFPHQTRKELRQRTVEDLERHYQVVCDIELRIITEIIDTVPLWETLFSIKREDGELDWGYDNWRDVYIKHNWTEVEDTKWYRRETKLIDEKQMTIGRGDLLPVNENEKWNDFEKVIDGVTYKNSYAEDQQQYWHWFWWYHNKDSFRKRLDLIRKASYDLDCLGHYTSLFIHEAFLIMIGVSPDNMDRKEFKNWLVGNITLDFEELDYPETKVDWFKQDYRDFKEWQILTRRFGNEENGLDIEIDTQDFIQWALKNGYIEEDTSHYRDGRKAPYEESFSKMLHKELLANDLIKECRQEDEWTWNIKPTNGANSFNYLGRLLALNRVPIKYWLPYEKHSVSWQNLQHYIVGVKNPQKHTTLPANAITIENIVKKLLEEHDERPFTEYRDLEE